MVGGSGATQANTTFYSTVLLEYDPVLSLQLNFCLYASISYLKIESHQELVRMYILCRCSDHLITPEFQQVSKPSLEAQVHGAAKPPRSIQVCYLHTTSLFSICTQQASKVSEMTARNWSPSFRRWLDVNDQSQLES